MKIQPYRITIDDLGLYPEVEIGITKLEKYQIPIYCSWLANFFSPVTINKSHIFKNGLHFNLLEGTSLSGSKYLTNKNGIFNKSWTSFIYANKFVKSAVQEELSFQLEKTAGWFSTISHLDSHLHIHSIPWIYSLLEKEKNKRGISYLRNPKQRLLDDPSVVLSPKAFIKILILNTLSQFSQPKQPSCLGLNRLFQMSAAYCVSSEYLSQHREIIWHAAEIPSTLDLDQYRFLSQANYTPRKKELEQLEKYLSHLNHRLGLNS